MTEKKFWFETEDIVDKIFLKCKPIGKLNFQLCSWTHKKMSRIFNQLCWKTYQKVVYWRSYFQPWKACSSHIYKEDMQVLELTSEKCIGTKTSMTADKVVVMYTITPLWRNPPWRGEGAYLTKRFSPSTSRSRARQSNAATFDKDKQICFMPMPRTWFKVEEFRLE